ncbi:TPA: hypothetical protein L4J47_003596 [Enterobacter kobei]|nr:hypothetical protein [Enterobacter kobei]HBO1178611.1 hypothetical protein [Enterobacter kobei]HBO1182962.1 hypothetical protein [Enterobacter kobei]HBO2010072.1 hypothetical protein [Enterobacter kobei]HBO2417418.1 hypothetical protein [Enterobacter kobei]
MPIKDIILLSPCLSGHLVRYNGTDKSCSSDLLQHWREEGRLVTHCPELAAWLALKTAQSQGGIENPRALGSIPSPGTTV